MLTLNFHTFFHKIYQDGRAAPCTAEEAGHFQEEETWSCRAGLAWPGPAGAASGLALTCCEGRRPAMCCQALGWIGRYRAEVRMDIIS